MLRQKNSRIESRATNPAMHYVDFHSRGDVAVSVKGDVRLPLEMAKTVEAMLLSPLFSRRVGDLVLWKHVQQLGDNGGETCTVQVAQKSLEIAVLAERVVEELVYIHAQNPVV